MSGGAHNRFYGELETWLSTMTRISGGDGDDAFASDVAEQLAFVSQQMSALNRIIAEGEDRRAADSGKIADAMAGIERIVAQAAEERETVGQSHRLARAAIVAAVERMAEKRRRRRRRRHGRRNTPPYPQYRPSDRQVD